MTLIDTYKTWPRWARIAAPSVAGLLIIGALAGDSSDPKPKVQPGATASTTTSSASAAAPTTSPSTTATTAAKASGRVGSPAVYDEIAAKMDCGALQATFDRAEATSRRSGGPPKGDAFVQERYGNWSQIGIAYMGAADARMRAIGCY
jgi:hypothetical protein